MTKPVSPPDTLLARVTAAAAWLRARGIVIPDDLAAEIETLKALRAVKYSDGQQKSSRRDRREPGWKEKEKLEDRLLNAIARRFRRQRGKLAAALSLHFPDRKAADLDLLINLDDFWTDDENDAELVRLIIQSTQNGIALFGQEIPFRVDYTLTNAEAAKKAREYAYSLIKDIDKKSLEALRSAISAFVETPGMTIRDTMDLLPYNERRAALIATSEITRAYAQGQQVAGEALRKEFPDVRIIKRWYTNEDDKVCDICSSLDGQEVDIDEKYHSDVTGEDYDGPGDPHPGDRCWQQTSTSLIES